MNNRKLLAAACSAALLTGTVAAPAQAAGRIDPIGKECKAASAAAKAGLPIPGIGNFVFSDNENAIDGNVVRINSPEKYKPYVKRATDEWVRATGGLLRFEFVDQPGYKVVTVREATLGSAVGRVTGDVHNMQLLLEPAILRNGYIDSLVMTITHELGHAMGLAHSCDGALMKDGTNRGKLAHTPQALDIQVLIQHNNLKQFADRPAPTVPSTSVPAPAVPSTSVPAPASSTREVVVPPQVNPSPQTEQEAQEALRLAERNLAAAQSALDAAERALDDANVFTRSRLAREVSNAQQRVANAESAVRAAEQALAEFALTSTEPASSAPASSAPASSEPASSEPARSTEAPAPAAPRGDQPRTLAEAIDAKDAAEHAYIAADERARNASQLGLDPGAAERDADVAWEALQSAEANLAAYRAAHSNETVPADQPADQPAVSPEPAVPSPVTMTIVTTIIKEPTTSVAEEPTSTVASEPTRVVEEPTSVVEEPTTTVASEPTTTVASEPTSVVKEPPTTVTQVPTTTVAPITTTTSVESSAPTTTEVPEPAAPTVEKRGMSPLAIAGTVVASLLAVIGAGWAIAKFF